MTEIIKLKTNYKIDERYKITKDDSRMLKLDLKSTSYIIYCMIDNNLTIIIIIL